MYIDKLDNIVNKYNNTFHSAIKKKHVDVKSNTYIDFTKEINSKDPKLRIGDIVIISKYENILSLKILELFTKKNCKKNQKEFRTEKVIKRKVKRYILNGKDTVIYLIAG